MKLFKLVYFFCFVVLTAVFLSGCNFSGSEKKHDSKEHDSLIAKIQDLEDEISNLKTISRWFEKDVERLEEKSNELESKVLDLEVVNSTKTYALFDLSKGNEGYQEICIKSGTFFVLLKSATPHLSGYKLVFSIGNPSLATYENIKLKLKWNRSFKSYYGDVEFQSKMDKYVKDSTEYFELITKNKALKDSLKKPVVPTRPLWSDAFKEKEFSILKKIEPGAWNTVEVHVTPAQLQDLEHIEVSIETSIVNLLNSN